MATKNKITEYVEHLKKIKGLSERTIYHYLTYHKHFMDQELTQDNIRKFVKSKKNNSVCRSYMISWLEFNGVLKEFDLPIKKTGSKKTRLINYISKQDMEKLIKGSYKSNVKYGLIIDIIYWGALRRFEIIDLKINSFNWDKWFKDLSQFCEYRIIGKRNKERVVLAHPKTIKRILEILMKRGIITHYMHPDDITQKLKSNDTPLFKNLKERNILWHLQKNAVRILQRPVRTHEIRHARATHLEEDGATIRQIQKYLGHTSTQTTEIYLHTDETKALDQIKSLTQDL